MWPTRPLPFVDRFFTICTGLIQPGKWEVLKGLSTLEDVIRYCYTDLHEHKWTSPLNIDSMFCKLEGGGDCSIIYSILLYTRPCPLTSFVHAFSSELPHHLHEVVSPITFWFSPWPYANPETMSHTPLVQPMQPQRSSSGGVVRLQDPACFATLRLVVLPTLQLLHHHILHVLWLNHTLRYPVHSLILSFCVSPSCRL